MAYARVKPLNVAEVDDRIAENFEINETTIAVHTAGQKGDVTTSRFTFEKVFPPKTSQGEVFEAAALPGVGDLLAGESSLIFSYGSSSSGKTFTMQGTGAQPGILPRALYAIFASLESRLDDAVCFRPSTASSPTYLTETEKLAMDMKKTAIIESLASSRYVRHSFNDISTHELTSVFDESPVLANSVPSDSVCSVWVSFCEIYNEMVFDLLSESGVDQQQQLNLAYDRVDGSYYPSNLENFHVRSWEEAYQLYRYGWGRAHVAETVLNRKSSRSHCVFSVKVIVREAGMTDEFESMAAYHVCDLAGNERIGHTVASGDIISQESRSINKSLLALNKCFMVLRGNKSGGGAHVPPFRDSKLTMIFKRFLFGKGKLTMVANISQDSQLLSQTQHVLKIMSIAHELGVQPIRPPPTPRVRARRFSTLYGRPGAHQNSANSAQQVVEPLGRREVEMLRRENESLRQQLAEERASREQLADEAAALQQLVHTHRLELEQAEAQVSSLKDSNCEISEYHGRYIAGLKKILAERTQRLHEHWAEADKRAHEERELTEKLADMKKAFQIDTNVPAKIIQRAIFLYGDAKQAAEEELEENLRQIESLEAENAALLERLSEATEELKYLKNGPAESPPAGVDSSDSSSELPPPSSARKRRPTKSRKKLTTATSHSSVKGS